MTAPAEVKTAASIRARIEHHVSLAFLTENTERQAMRDPHAMSMSGVGGCTRQNAYRLARTPPSDQPPPEEARQALLGTWIHEHLLPHLLKLSGPTAVIEQPVQLTIARLYGKVLTIRGTLDFAEDDEVGDVKSVKEWRLAGVRRHGTYAEHRIQVWCYALARFQAGFPVRWVWWLYIDRATGEVQVEVEEFTDEAAFAVLERINLIADNAAYPDLAPREGRGPGLAIVCDRCPWLTRCWGPTAVAGQVGAQTSLAATQEGIETALGLYSRSQVAESAAGKDKEYAKAILSSTPPATYGAWKLGRSKPGTSLDQQQVRADYAARGLPVPTIEKAGAIRVTPVRSTG